MYVELHARSAFSFLEGASVPEELIAAGQELQMPAMALLDRDGVYGAPRFHLSAKKNDIKAHIGAEITVQLPHAKPGSCSVTGDELSAHAAGLVCLTGAVDGPVAAALNRGNGEAQKTVDWL